MLIKETLEKLMNSDALKESMTERQISIVIAAIELFSEKSYNGTSTKEIAKKANVSEGTIFRYYQTKKDLLYAIPTCLAKTSLSQVLLKDINEIFSKDHETFEAFLRNLIENRKEFVSANLPVLKVLIQEVPFHPELKDKLLEEAIRPTMGPLIKAIDFFKEKGELIDLPSSTIPNLILTSIFGYFFLRYIVKLELNWDKEHETEYLIQYIMNGICKPKAITNNPIL